METTTSLIRALNLTALAEHQYINFHCLAVPGCDIALDTFNLKDNINGNVISQIREFWQSIFAPPPSDASGTRQDADMTDPQQTGQMPKHIQSGCCGQFTVTRDAIRSLSRSEWERVRSPPIRGPQDYIWGQGGDFGDLALMYEPLWHLFFGRPAMKSVCTAIGPVSVPESLSEPFR